MTITSRRELARTRDLIRQLERSIESARRRLAGEPEILESLISIHSRHLEELKGELRDYLDSPRGGAGAGRAKLRR